MKYGGGIILFWDCYPSTELGKLFSVDGKIDGTKYRAILDENSLLATINMDPLWQGNDLEVFG